MIWGFVDYENTGTLEGIRLDAYERLLIFCGPKNNKIKIGELSTTEFCHIEIMKIAKTAKNNLDFHLAFHLGDLHGTVAREIEFHVISNDTGFEGLVQHIRKIGRKCDQVTLTKPAKDKQSTKPRHELSDCGKLVLNRLSLMDGRTRPRKASSLVNWINSQCQHMKPPVIPADVLNELVTHKLMKNEGNKITYTLS